MLLLNKIFLNNYNQNKNVNSPSLVNCTMSNLNATLTAGDISHPCIHMFSKITSAEQLNCFSLDFFISSDIL